MARIAYAESESFFESTTTASVFDEPPGKNPRSPAAAPGSGVSDSRALFEAAQIVIPDAQHVVRMQIGPGEVIELPFGPEAHFLARLGDGNLAVRVGDVTVILEGYVAAASDPQHPVVVESADGKPLDIATLLASTDPALDIETAAGPGGNGVHGGGTSGAILQPFGGGHGLGGFQGIGAQGDSTGPGHSGSGFAVGHVGVNNPPLVTASPEATPSPPARPVAVDDSYAVNENHTLVVAAPGLLANDHTDAAGDPIAVKFYSLPAHGTLITNADGGLTYTPDKGYVGDDSFKYDAGDGKSLSDFATVHITVNADAPVAVDDSYSVNENHTLIVAAPGLLANDHTDAEGEPITVKFYSLPAHGTLITNADGGLTYTPDKGYIGDDSFKYDMGDGKSLSDFATVHITVNEDAPVAVDDSYSINENHTLVVAAPGLLANDHTDAEGEPITVKAYSLPAHGTLITNADGGLTYTPDKGYIGDDSFKYYVGDGKSLSNFADVHITVNEDAPVAVDDSYTVSENHTLTVAAPGLLANDHTDAEGEPIAVKFYGFPAHGTVVANADGSFTYTPDKDYTGADSFTYDMGDGKSLSNFATVHITVAPELLPLAAAAIGTEGHVGTSFQGTVAHETLIGSDKDETFDGRGGNDLIFAGGGQDTIFYHPGDKVDGGADGISGTDLVNGAHRGDVLVLSGDVTFDASLDGAIKGIETLSFLHSASGSSGGSHVTLDAQAVAAMSDHSLTPGALFATAPMIRIEGDSGDQVTLSNARGAGSWSAVETAANGAVVFAHETDPGDAATANAYVVINHPLAAHVDVA
jgi:hypothetical protein